MNEFDAAVTAFAIFAIVTGFRAGLLRSLATIIGYLIAAPIAVAIAPQITPFVLGHSTNPADLAWLPLVVVFVAVGIVVGALLRILLNEFVGSEPGLPDRLAGAALGAVRTLLLAVLVVVAFDRIIPAGREPPFLAGSKLRPYLSAAGQEGLQSLPPDIEDYIDRLKRERGL
jgi:membrane protein required for colicin V production